MGNSMYVIMFIAAICYTLIIGIGFIQAAKKQRKNIMFLALYTILDDVKSKIHKEEIMDKGSYKNTRDSEYIKNLWHMTDGLEEKGQGNGLTLSHIINQEPTEENYAEVIDLLATLAKAAFNDYKFLIAKSQDEAKDTNFLQVVSQYAEAPELHKEIFTKSINYNIDMKVLVEKFAARVAQGDVFPLGDDVVVITDDGSGQLPTGVSPINSGLEHGEIAFIVSFIKKENLEAFKAEHFPKEAVSKPNEDE